MIFVTKLTGVSSPRPTKRGAGTATAVAGRPDPTIFANLQLSERVPVAFSTLLYEERSGLAVLTVNRPDKLNALNDQVIGELGLAASQIASNPAIRGVLLTGAGPKAFVAGADISELADQGPQRGKERSLMGQQVFRQFEAMRKPVVAAVNGFCLGGGCELAMACHIRVASETAKFGQPEVKLGIGPGYGGTVRLPRLVGTGRALELLLTGSVIDAQEAWRIGLVNKVVPADKLLSEAEGLLRTILAQGPLAVASVLELVDAGGSMSPAEALLFEANHFGLLSGTADMREGMAAFLAKRPARFEGR